MGRRRQLKFGRLLAGYRLLTGGVMAFFYSATTGGFYEQDLSVYESLPDDLVEITDDEHGVLLNGQSAGKSIKAGADGKPYLVDPPPPTEEQQIRVYEKAAQAHMDAAAREHGYDNVATAVSYADEPAVTKFQREGKAFREWRSLVWAYCYDQLAKYKAGQIEKPTVEQLIAALPALVIPTA